MATIALFLLTRKPAGDYKRPSTRGNHMETTAQHERIDYIRGLLSLAGSEEMLANSAGFPDALRAMHRRRASGYRAEAADILRGIA